MSFRPPVSSTVGFAAQWLWAPRPHPSRRSEELLRFREKLIASLRVGHGLGAEFELRLRSGGESTLALSCATFSGARWITRVLAPVYAGSPWVRRPEEAAVAPPAVFWGRRALGYPHPLREPEERPPASENLLLALRGISTGVWIRWRFSPWPACWPGPLESWATDSNHIGRFPSPRARERAPPSRDLEPPSGRSPPLFWKTVLEVGVSRGPGPESDATAVRRAVEAALRSNHGNGVRLSPRLLRSPWPKPWFAVSEAELAGILPGIDGRPDASESTSAWRTASILPLGRSATGRVAGPPVEPTQGRHLAILGETGMGKSSALIAVARKATTLGGLVLFDPLGETARSFRAGLSAEELRRLLWISADGPPCGINALEGAHGAGTDPVLADRRLNDLVHALRRVRSGRYSDSNFWGPRLEEMLGRALLAAAAFPGGTLVDAHTLLATGGRTRQVVPVEAQEEVHSLADRIRERPEDAEGARRLLYEVVRSPVLKALLCARTPRLHTKDLVEEGRIAVISGDASTVGETSARYLLAVYLALVWSELLGRGTRAKTFVVLDECQWFSHESLAEMLRLARRKNVHVILATQTIRSLPEGVADAVWTNVSDFLAFRGSPEEARELARSVDGVTAEELLALPRGHAVVLLGKGSAVHWVRSSGRPPEPEEDPPGRPLAFQPTPPAESEAFPRRPSFSTIEDGLRALVERARGLPPGTRLRVDLSELRKTGDAEERTIRALGARLGRVGALVATEHCGGRRTWVIEPAKIPSPENGTVVPPAQGPTSFPQPS